MKATRTILWSSLGLLFAVASFAYWTVETRLPQLELGVGYAARVACGCRYIGDRSLGDCRKDFEPGMELIQLSENTKTKTVTASVPVIASRSVSYDPVLGCKAQPFRGSARIVGP